VPPADTLNTLRRDGVKRLKLNETWQLHLLLLPIVVLLVIFAYIPMVGLVISFQNFIPTLGFFNSPWVGLDNFRFLFSLRDFPQIIRNTLLISTGKIVLGLSTSLFFAILLSETNFRKFRGAVQNIIFVVFFISWVVLGGIFVDMFSLNGIINNFLGFFGIEPIFFLGNLFWFPIIMIITDVWKIYGYNMIIFYAAIVGVDSSLYESASLDGAGRIRMIWSITIPSILPIIAVMGLLSLGHVLNAGFEQIFNMYNPTVYRTGDILDTFIFRTGIMNGQFSLATAVGFFRSVVSLILIVIGNWAAKKFAGYQVF